MNGKGILEQAIEREPHAEHIVDYCMYRKPDWKLRQVSRCAIKFKGFYFFHALPHFKNWKCPTGQVLVQHEEIGTEVMKLFSHLSIFSSQLHIAAVHKILERVSGAKKKFFNPVFRYNMIDYLSFIFWKRSSELERFEPRALPIRSFSEICNIYIANYILKTLGFARYFHKVAR